VTTTPTSSIWSCSGTSLGAGRPGRSRRGGARAARGRRERRRVRARRPQQHRHGTPRGGARGRDPETGVETYSPTLRLWPDATPRTVGGHSTWPTTSISRRSSAGSTRPPSAARLTSRASSSTSTSSLRTRFSARTENDGWTCRRTTVAVRAWPTRRSTSRPTVNYLAVKLSHDLSDGDNALYRVGDGSQTVDHYLVCTRETVLNDDLRTPTTARSSSSRTGSCSGTTTRARTTWSSTTRRSSIWLRPEGPRTSPGRPHCNEEADDEQCWTAGKVDLEDRGHLNPVQTTGTKDCFERARCGLTSTANSGCTNVHTYKHYIIQRQAMTLELTEMFIQVVGTSPVIQALAGGYHHCPNESLRCVAHSRLARSV